MAKPALAGGTRRRRLLPARTVVVERPSWRRLRADLAQASQNWPRQLLIAGLLMVCLGLAQLAVQGSLWLFVFPAVALAGVLACLRWPVFALTVACIAGLLVPWRGPSGLNVTMMLVAGLPALWLLAELAHKRAIWLPVSGPIGPLLAFLTVALLSFGLGQLPWFSFAQAAPLGAQLGGLAIVLLSGCAFLMAAIQVPSMGALRKLTGVFLAFSAAYVILRMVLPEFGLATRDYVQPAGSVFYIWLITLAFSQAACNVELPRGWRLALASLVVVAMTLLLFRKYADKSSWLPALAGIIAIGAVRWWRIGGVLIVAAGLAAIVLGPQVLLSEDYSFSTRFEAALIVLNIVEVSPIWGTGFANYYWFTPLFPIRGYAISFNSHNNYLDILAQTGWVGLACFVLFLGALGLLAWRLRTRAPAGFAQAYVYGALGGLAGMAVAAMLGDWMLPFFYNIGLNGFRSSVIGWVFLGGLVSLERLALQPPRK